MAQIIIDLGSGNTCKNDWDYAKRMIDEIDKIDTRKHEVILKWQLFEKAGGNVPLDWYIFNKAYRYAGVLGYKTTASVFDKSSLIYLLEYDVPFIKIANNRDLDYLIGEIPRRIPVYVSNNDINIYSTLKGFGNCNILFCKSSYPASIVDYLELDYFTNKYDPDKKVREFFDGISDHTTDWQIFNEYNPNIYECHFKLEDSTGLDAGEFARTPRQLAEIL